MRCEEGWNGRVSGEGGQPSPVLSSDLLPLSLSLFPLILTMIREEKSRKSASELRNRVDPKLSPLGAVLRSVLYAQNSIVRRRGVMQFLASCPFNPHLIILHNFVSYT